MPDTTLQEQANAALKSALVPRPEDLLSEVNPVAVVWYLQETAAYALLQWTAEATNMDDSDEEENTMAADVLSGLAEIVGMLNTVCVTLGLMEE